MKAFRAYLIALSGIACFGVVWLAFSTFITMKAFRAYLIALFGVACFGVVCALPLVAMWVSSKGPMWIREGDPMWLAFSTFITMICLAFAGGGAICAAFDRLKSRRRWHCRQN